VDLFLSEGDNCVFLIGGGEILDTVALIEETNWVL
jgi:hypothetical protein